MYRDRESIFLDGLITYFKKTPPIIIITFNFKPQLHSITGIFSIFVTYTPFFFNFYLYI